MSNLHLSEAVRVRLPTSPKQRLSCQDSRCPFETSAWASRPTRYLGMTMTVTWAKLVDRHFGKHWTNGIGQNLCPQLVPIPQEPASHRTGGRDCFGQEPGERRQGSVKSGAACWPPCQTNLKSNYYFESSTLVFKCVRKAVAAQYQQLLKDWL